MKYIDIITTIVVAVLGSTGLWTGVWAFIQSRNKHNSAQERMLLGLGHSEIFRCCEKYIARGGITKEELDDLLLYLFEPYRSLGGNGSGEALVNRCKTLPIISAAEAEELDRKRHLE